MTPELNLILITLEVSLIAEEDPGYIEVSFQNDAIFILLSKTEYKYYGVNERVSRIFEILKLYHMDVLEKYLVVVECLDDSELTELFRIFHG